MLELLVAAAITMIVVALLFQIITSSGSLLSRTSGKVGAFQEARAGFETMVSMLSRATLQPYHAYADASGNPVPLVNPSFRLAGGSEVSRDRVPVAFLPMSELHFVAGHQGDIFSTPGQTGGATDGSAVFFQAPLGYSESTNLAGLDRVVTVCGFYVRFDNGFRLAPDPAVWSGPELSESWRYQLVQVVQPAEAISIYDSTNQVDSDGFPISTYDVGWLGNALTNGVHSVLANNVILLVMLPRLSPAEEERLAGVADGSYLAPQYGFDSRSWEVGYSGTALATPRHRNQLPPVVDLVMVVLEERSAARLAMEFGGSNESSPPLANATLRSELGLNGAFERAEDLDGDLARLEEGLNRLGLAYRVFRTQVALEGAKWSG